MIRNIIELIMLIVLGTYSIFVKDINDIKTKFDEFYLRCQEDIKYEVSDDIYVGFDYKKIEYHASELFDNYTISEKEKIRFVISVEINNFIFKKDVKQQVYIRKGDLYDSNH